MKLLLPIFVGLLFQFQATAQDNNHLITNVSYAFFGTGDLSGTAIGLDYHRTLFGRFGLHLGYSKATGQGDNTLQSIGTQNRGVLTNLSLDGNGEQASGLANYNTYLIGVNYKVADGNKHILLASGGLNYKQLKYNYLSSFLAENVNNQGVAESVSIQSTTLVAENEAGFYIGLDYLYVFDNSISLGLHFAVENSSNIVSKAGLSLGFRF